MSTPSIGSLVRFRGREWIIIPSNQKDTLLLRPLRGSESDTTGVFLPLEGDSLESVSFRLPDTSDLGDYESVRLFGDAGRLMLRNGAGPFRSIGHLSFRPRPYQLVPLLMALRLDPVRMLLADDVGVGKTIEAGLIARELLDRGDARRLAVLCPPHLCDQWQKELSQKFHSDAKIVGTHTLARLERNLPKQNLSIFEYYPHLIVSIDFVKSQRRRDAFLLHCPDLVIIDEAHGCAKPAGQSLSQQQRHEFVHLIAQKKDQNLILVTATPHSGIEESFLSLLGFIHPDFSCLDLSTLDKESRSNLSRHFVQRARGDIRHWMDTSKISATGIN